MRTSTNNGQVLLDTNVLLRIADLGSPEHALAAAAVAALLRRGDQPVITAQCLVELWAVATRPVKNNGFGWDCPRAQTTVQDLLARFPLLLESDLIFPAWLNLVSTHAVSGKQVHDTRLVAVVLANGMKDIVTFNTADFVRFHEIVAVHPSAV